MGTPIVSENIRKEKKRKQKTKHAVIKQGKNPAGEVANEKQ